MKKIFTILLLTAACKFATAQGKFFGGNGDGFSTATIISQLLPVSITDFNAKLQQNTVALSFGISSDVAFCNIIIERSLDGRSFSGIDTINASSGGGYYDRTFTREDRHPGSGKNYYRVKIIYCTGNNIYSKVVLVNVTAQGTVYYADRTLYYQVKDQTDLKIFNSQGQLVLTKKLPQGSGTVSLDMQTKGLYVCKLSDGTSVRIVVE
ncbi:MAG: T9SS type A sorting domain-containing protein [Ferruginibacter sp.]